MEQQAGAETLFTLLQLSQPAARTIFLTSARDIPAVDVGAAHLAAAAEAAGFPVRRLMVYGPDQSSLTPQAFADVARARASIAPGDGYSIVSGSGLLDHPRLLILAAACDAVVLVAVRGRTPRAGLTEARGLIESAGGLLAAAVLV